MRTTPVSEFSRSLHRGLEECDVPVMLSLFDDNAEVRIIDKDHPPSRPLILSDKDSRENYFNDVLNRPTTHHIDDEAMSDSHYAYTESCEYPDGSKVFSSVMATLKDGKIVKEVEVQAWD